MGQQKEFDPFFHNVIKDAETEKKVRELHEKAYGIDFVKTERKKYADELQTVKPQFEQLSSRVEELDGYLAQGNLAAFQRATGLEDKHILVRAKQIIDAMENPNLRSQEEAEFANQQQLREMGSQNKQLLAQVGQARLFELRSILQRPNVSSIAQAYDARVGAPGSFEREVINRGAMHYQLNKVDKSAEELVNEILGFMGANPGGGMQQQIANPTEGEQTQNQPEAQAAPQQQGTRVVPPKKPTIPNITGRGTSPVKKAINSIDDLRQRGKELANV
jgi:hypothetical protein